MPGIPVVVVTSRGLGVTVAPNGLPMTVATNGYGIPVMQVTNGLPVSGITFGPDVTAPIITSSNTISQPENSVLNHVLTANETVTWAKVGGADTAKFTLVGNILTLPAKDYEIPDDADANRSYIVQVQATDTASNPSTIQTITVTITDVVEAGPVVITMTDGSAVNNAFAPLASFSMNVGSYVAATHDLIFFAGDDQGGNIGTATIGGVAATLVEKNVTDGKTAIFTIPRASGVSVSGGNVTVAVSGSAWAISLFAIGYASGNTSSTPTAHSTTPFTFFTSPNQISGTVASGGAGAVFWWTEAPATQIPISWLPVGWAAVTATEKYIGTGNGGSTSSAVQGAPAAGTYALDPQKPSGGLAFVAFANSGSTATWSALKVGAGGWVQDIDIHSDGTMVTRTDTYGGHVWNAAAANPGNAGGTGAWQQLVTPSRMPVSDPSSDIDYIRFSFGSNQGIYEIKIAPSNSSTFYMAYLGYVYKSTDKGVTWTRQTNFAAVTVSDMASNGAYRFYGPRMAIDPINTNRVFLGLNTNGCWKTTDGGTTWTKISTGSIPNPTVAAGIFFACSTRAADQSGGNTQVIFAFSYGNGCYKSTDAGVNWTKISGSGTATTSLTTCRRMVYEPLNNILWVASGNSTTTGVYKYNGTTWSNPTISVNNGGQYHSIAFDPLVGSAQRIILGDDQGILTQSNDGGSTWSGSYGPPFGNGNLAATDIPWLATVTDLPANGNMAFNAAGALYWANGIGVFSGNPPTTFVGSGGWNSWNSRSAGIEQLVANQLVSPPSGSPICVNWDRAVYKLPVTTFPTTVTPVGFVTPPGGLSADWASAAPANVFVGAQDGNLYYSTNSGTSWSTKAGLPLAVGGGGCIAASSANALLWAQTNGDLYYSTNAGTSWTSRGAYFSSTFGIAAGGTGWTGFSNTQDIQCICADRVDTTTFYAHNSNAAGSGGGLYMSTDGGVNWTKQVANDTANGLISGGNEGGNAQLKSVPGNSGHLLWTGGPSYIASAHPYAFKMRKSTNHGVTWTDINANLREVWVFGVGKQIGSYPRIAVWGWFSSVLSIWRSDDGGTSWADVGPRTTNGTYDVPRWLEVDNNDGSIYVGYAGSGWARYG